MEVSFPGGAFLKKLEAEMHGIGAFFARRIPRTRRPRASAWNVSPPHVDAYGFRGTNEQVLYLSPYEFFMYWDVQRVPEPFRQNCSGWSVWTEEGKDYYEEHKQDYNFKLVPGKHYKADTCSCLHCSTRIALDAAKWPRVQART